MTLARDGKEYKLPTQGGASARRFGQAVESMATEEMRKKAPGEKARPPHVSPLSCVTGARHSCILSLSYEAFQGGGADTRDPQFSGSLLQQAWK